MERSRRAYKEIETDMSVKKECRGTNKRKYDAEIYLLIQLVFLAPNIEHDWIYLVQNYI
jgi:hypothetical protein